MRVPLLAPAVAFSLRSPNISAAHHRRSPAADVTDVIRPIQAAVLALSIGPAPVRERLVRVQDRHFSHKPAVKTMIELREGHPMISHWSEGTAFHLDVRELLENGGEPYLYIMDCVNQLSGQEQLVVHALFEPKPLITQIVRMGLLAEAARVDEEHWTLTVSAPA